jgi:hypothetical protein
VSDEVSVSADDGEHEEREIVAAYERGYGSRPQEPWLGELGLTLLGDLISQEPRDDAGGEPL